MATLKKLAWIQEHLSEDVIEESMHDGKGYFWHEKLVLILIESSLTSLHRGVHYPFQIWNGCFFPVEKIKQNAVIKKFLFLENHPVLQNCLYLPAEDENFEEHARLVIREIFGGNPLFGEFIKIKKIVRPKAQSTQQVDGRPRPTLFLDDRVDENLRADQPINRGPRKKSATKNTPVKKLNNKKIAKKAENKFLLSKIK